MIYTDNDRLQTQIINVDINCQIIKHNHGCYGKDSPYAIAYPDRVLTANDARKNHSQVVFGFAETKEKEHFIKSKKLKRGNWIPQAEKKPTENKEMRFNFKERFIPRAFGCTRFPLPTSDALFIKKN